MNQHTKSTADVLSEFLASPPTQGLTKEAEEKVAASVMNAFVEASAQIHGVTPEAALTGLKKFAQSDPTGYQEYFQNWYTDFLSSLAQEQEKVAMEQARESTDMAKVAEADYLGRVMAHSFTSELGTIFDTYQQKLAEAQAEGGKEPEKEKEPEKDKEPEKEKEKEPEKKEPEKEKGNLPPALAEYMSREREPEGEKEGQKKIAELYAKLPIDVQIHHRSIVKKANAKFPLTEDDMEFLSNIDLHLQGLPVRW